MKKTLYGLILAVFLVGCVGPEVRRATSEMNRNPSSVQQPHFQTQMLTIDMGKSVFGQKILDLRIGIMNPVEAPLADVIFVHGFGDQLDNHLPLYRAWAARGLRVISFDLPGHGDDAGTANNLNDYSFQDLAFLMGRVETATRPEVQRPLLLSGWSTGGLIVVRTLQERWTKEFSRPVRGAVLLAPGVSVRKFPWTFGNRLGEVTLETLTHDPNPPHPSGEHDPTSPFWSRLIFEFSPRLILNSILSQGQVFPVEIPTYVVVGGDVEDMYAKTESVKEWVLEQNLARESSGRRLIMGLQCPQARHELDNELRAYGRDEVRQMTGQFLEQVARGEAVDFLYNRHQVCQGF